jgi:hypothetical protein
MNNFTLDKKEDTEKYYTIKGLESFVDEDNYPRLDKNSDNVFAKAVKNKLSKNFNSGIVNYSYYIKTDPNKNIYDPRTSYSIEPKIKKSFINSICKNVLVFTEVSHSIFTKYINFLKTENKKLLQEIQREIK